MACFAMYMYAIDVSVLLLSVLHVQACADK